jgi:hypothetical protein
MMKGEAVDEEEMEAERGREVDMGERWMICLADGRGEAPDRTGFRGELAQAVLGSIS